MRVTIVVFAYNEEENIAAVTEEIWNQLGGLNLAFELLIIDDGSLDNTPQIADSLARDLPGVRVVHHLENLGLGGVYRTGFIEALGRFVSFFPADGQFPATIISQFLPLMDDADLVLGYLPDRDSSLLARGLSFSERLLYRVLFGSFPRFQGVLMFRRSLLSDMKLTSEGRGWAVLMEFIIRVSKGGYRVHSVPTTMRPRLAGESKVNNLKTIVSNLVQIFMLKKNLTI
jgi:glycosyltransferase involved in cell wall biosynthesis